MRNTLKNLTERLARLEQHFHPERDRRLILLMRLEPSEREGLKPNERIVEDQYEDGEGERVMTKQRITPDPSDIGLCFPKRHWSRRDLRDYSEGSEYTRCHSTQPIQITWLRARRPEVSRKRECPHAPIQSGPLPENSPGDEPRR